MAKRVRAKQRRIKTLLRLIRRNPGISGPALTRHLGWNAATVTFRLRALEAEGQVVSRKYRIAKYYFLPTKPIPATWKAQAALHDPKRRRIHRWVQRSPGCIQQQIVDAAASWGCGRHSAITHLQALVESGLVDARRSGRTVSYRATRLSKTLKPLPRHLN